GHGHTRAIVRTLEAEAGGRRGRIVIGNRREELLTTLRADHPRVLHVTARLRDDGRTWTMLGGDVNLTMLARAWRDSPPQVLVFLLHAAPGGRVPVAFASDLHAAASSVGLVVA